MNTQQDNKDIQQEMGNSEYNQKNLEYSDKSKLNNHQQNPIHLKIIMYEIQTYDLYELNNFICEYDNISTLQIVFSENVNLSQVELDQLISILSRLQILYKLKILIVFSLLKNLDIFKFAYEISKNSPIQSFSIGIKYENPDAIQSFKIRQNNENGQNVVSQLEFMKNSSKYSDFQDLFQVSQNIVLTKLKLNVSQDELNLINETNLPKRLQSLQNLKQLKYSLHIKQVEYNQITYLNQVISSNQNLQKLDININLHSHQYWCYLYEMDNDAKYNPLIEKNFKNEKDQYQIEYLKIKEEEKQCKHIQNVNLIMLGYYKDVQVQSMYNFQINQFKSILWSILNVKILSIDIPNWIMLQFINEISRLQLLEVLTFKTGSNFLNEENTDILGISLNKCKKLKRLRMKINLNINQGKQQALIISNHLKQLSCQKSIKIEADKIKIFRNKNDNNSQINEELVDQIKEIIKLNNISNLKFNINFNFHEFITILKSISKLDSLQIISFIEYAYREEKASKYITCDLYQQEYTEKASDYWLYFKNDCLMKNINYYLKKAKKLVKINLFKSRIAYWC